MILWFFYLTFSISIFHPLHCVSFASQECCQVTHTLAPVRLQLVSHQLLGKKKNQNSAKYNFTNRFLFQCREMFLHSSASWRSIVQRLQWFRLHSSSSKLDIGWNLHKLIYIGFSYHLKPLLNHSKLTNSKMWNSTSQFPSPEDIKWESGSLSLAHGILRCTLHCSRIIQS